VISKTEIGNNEIFERAGQFSLWDQDWKFVDDSYMFDPENLMVFFNKEKRKITLK